MKFHQGIYRPKNPKKYRGDVSSIVYRSSWEAALMYWLDSNNEVTAWSSEEVVIPYLCPVDKKVHRYFIDFWIETTKGTFLVEVKPQRECLPPSPKSNKKRLLSETAVYQRNQAKWQAAEKYATSLGYQFFVWDETTLRQLGVVI